MKLEQEALRLKIEFIKTYKTWISIKNDPTTPHIDVDQAWCDYVRARDTYLNVG